MLFKEVHEKPKLPLKDFLIALYTSLIEVGCAQTQNSYNSSRARRRSGNTVLPVAAGIHHYPVRVPSQVQCVQCAKVKKETRDPDMKVSRTLYKCLTCKFPLCITCFPAFHGYEGPL